jgi:hypothetical protein
MDRRSFFFSSLFSLCLLAPIGCAATTDSEGPSEETGESEDGLTGGAKALVGTYYSHAPGFGGFARLTLNASGKYTAKVDSAGKALCVTSPCLLPESGTWNATKQPDGSFRLRIRASGEPSRYYDAVKSTSGLDIARSGKSEKLQALGKNACLDDADCGATEQCGPQLCLMYCEVNDPFCCGPSTCQPKIPTKKACGGFAGLTCGAGEECVDDPTDACDPTKGGKDCAGICQPKSPAPSCAGAWLDQSGLCRTPADGVYPAECCAGPKCGTAQCAGGEVCCNALSGICTKPGEVCAQ